MSMSRVVLAYITLIVLAVPGGLIIDAFALEDVAKLLVLLPIVLLVSLVAPEYFGWREPRGSPRGRASRW